jgi:hypothetical protein
MSAPPQATRFGVLPALPYWRRRRSSSSSSTSAKLRQESLFSSGGSLFGFRNTIESSKQHPREVTADYGRKEEQRVKYFVIGTVLLMISVLWVCSIWWSVLQGIIE